MSDKREGAASFPLDHAVSAADPNPDAPEPFVPQPGDWTVARQVVDNRHVTGMLVGSAGNGTIIVVDSHPTLSGFDEGWLYDEKGEQVFDREGNPVKKQEKAVRKLRACLREGACYTPPRELLLMTQGSILIDMVRELLTSIYAASDLEFADEILKLPVKFKSL